MSAAGMTDISTVVIFCCDGETGHRLAQLLCWSGRDVIAVLRGDIDTRRLEKYGAVVVHADPVRREEVETVFAGRDVTGMAVVCMLGGSPALNSQGNINVIDAAAKAGVDRFFMLTSIGCGDSVNAVDPLVRAFIGKALRAKNWAETHLKDSGLEWTIIRPGGMVRRGPMAGAMLVDSPNVSGYIDLTDLGDLIFHALESDKTSRRVLTAVDRGKAYDVMGEPVVPAKL